MRHLKKRGFKMKNCTSHKFALKTSLTSRRNLPFFTTDFYYAGFDGSIFMNATAFFATISCNVIATASIFFFFFHREISHIHFSCGLQIHKQRFFMNPSLTKVPDLSFSSRSGCLIHTGGSNHSNLSLQIKMDR